MRIPTGTIVTLSVLAVLSVAPLLAGNGASLLTPPGATDRPESAAAPEPRPRATGATPLPVTRAAQPAGPEDCARTVGQDHQGTRSPGPADSSVPTATRTVVPPEAEPEADPCRTEEATPQPRPDTPDLPGDTPAPGGTGVMDIIFDSLTGVLGG